jgi:hypothetical protein
MKYRMVIGLLTALSTLLGGQPTDLPPQGIYPDALAFLEGRPSHQWQELLGEWYFSPEDHYARCNLMTAAGEGLTPQVVCRDGECYLLDPDLRDGEVLYYARLMEIGPISVFHLRREYVEEIPIRAYNPANGRPFLQGKVPRPREAQYLAMWRPGDDQRKILDRYSFQEWTGFEAPASGKDTDLIRGIRMYNQLSASEADPKNY